MTNFGFLFCQIALLLSRRFIKKSISTALCLPGFLVSVVSGVFGGLDVGVLLGLSFVSSVAWCSWSRIGRSCGSGISWCCWGRVGWSRWWCVSWGWSGIRWSWARVRWSSWLGVRWRSIADRAAWDWSYVRGAAEQQVAAAWNWW